MCRSYVGRPAGAVARTGASGSERRRSPPAAASAFAIAGASPMMGVSPAPADGRSLRSSMTTSIGGTSVNRGTRYWRIVPFSMRPSAKSIGFEQRAADTLNHAAGDLVAQAVRVDDGTALEGDREAREARLLPCARFDFDRRGDVAALVEADGKAEQHARPRDATSSQTAPPRTRAPHVREGSSMFFSRKASGIDARQCGASSSMCTSRAKLLAVAARAR